MILFSWHTKKADNIKLSFVAIFDLDKYFKLAEKTER